METRIHPNLIHREDAQQAEQILRNCVHCGFCTAVCPTYQLSGDELDGPRGRIYLVREMINNDEIAAEQQQHFDRCLTCRSCETTCPSGVEYGQLLDIARGLSVERYQVSGLSREARVKRQLIKWFVPRPRLMQFAYATARLVRRWLPSPVKKLVAPDKCPK